MQLKPIHQAKLDEWLSVTQEIYKQLQVDNFKDGSEINLTYAFSNANEKASQDFAKALEKQLGYMPKVDFLPEEENESAVYIICGKINNTKSYLNHLNELLTKLISLGAEYDCLFEYWEAELPSNQDIFNLNIANLDYSDEETADKFPLLLHLQVEEDIGPVARREKYREPIKQLLETYSLGVITRSGSLCNMKDDELEVTGFEMIFRIADAKATIAHISNLINGIVSQENYQFKMLKT